MTDEQPAEAADDPLVDAPTEGDRRAGSDDLPWRRPGADPDAPGNYVDDERSAEVPEPNEPG